MSRTAIAMALGLVVLLGGCASVPAPTDKLVQAEVAIDQAAAAGAGQYAQESMRQARQYLGSAQTAVADNDNLKARYDAETAMIYAQLAQSQARAELAEQRADKAENDVARLRADIERQREY